MVMAGIISAGIISLSTLATVVGIGASLYGAYTAYQGQQQQKQANANAVAQAQASSLAQQKQFNQANQKSPDIASILYGNRQASSGGQGGTLTSGPGGVANSQLSLGKQSLLGM
jgi:uncharacterized membrane protein YebE (DUF533 family)